MEYTVKKLAQLSGVSSRTLRYYDEIGLLKPERSSSNGYRIYGQSQVDTLQQILFYRELGVGLEEIRRIMLSPDFLRERALQDHLKNLLERKEQLEKLINNVSKTIRSLKGEEEMSNQEKFEGFKKELIEENEEKYGKEIREKYGDATIDCSNAKLAGMSEEQWEQQKALEIEICEVLAAAVAEGNPQSEAARKACELHRQWLCMFWPEGTYSKEAHLGICEMYVADERFRKYYEDIAKGAAEFLRDAVKTW